MEKIEFFTTLATLVTAPLLLNYFGVRGLRKEVRVRLDDTDAEIDKGKDRVAKIESRVLRLERRGRSP